jgi:hypothetical protein
MVLATHAVIGGALATVAHVDPVLAFGLGFVSHFVLDSIPHWDYHLESSVMHESGNELLGDFVIDKRFVFDLIKIGTDFLTGFVLVFLFLYSDKLNFSGFITSTVFWGAVGGVVPDFLQFVYFKTKREPMTSLQRLHIWVHADTHLDNWHYVGPAIQLTMIALALFLSVNY